MYAANQLFSIRRSKYNSKHNLPLNIEIGYSIWNRTHKIFLRTRKNYSVVSVLAKSRRGKSAMLKMVGYKVWLEKRKVIVLDPFGEWASVGELNLDARFPDMVTDLCLIKNFAFRISEMIDDDYWFQLGFTARSIPYLQLIRKHFELYEDDPDKFFGIIESIPSISGDIRLWNYKYKDIPDLQLISLPHEATRKSLLEVSHFVKHFFFNPNKDLRENIEDWEEKISANNFIIIDFDAVGESLEMKKRIGLKCAIVMDKIGYKQIEKYHPVIFVEEASYFIPSEKELPFSLSRSKFDELNMKKLRHGMFVFYINQNHETVGKTVMRDKFQMIVGDTSETDIIWNEIGTKYKSLLKKPRVFIYVDENGRQQPFYSGDCIVGC